jgi:hypothetical protein
MTTALQRVRPLALKRRAQAFDNSDWLFELKYDGFRALLEIDDAGARLLSRNRNRFKHLDPLAAALAKRLRCPAAPCWACRVAKQAGVTSCSELWWRPCRRRVGSRRRHLDRVALTRLGTICGAQTTDGEMEKANQSRKSAALAL